MNSTLTVYLVSEHLSVDHPVGHVEDVARQPPGGLLVRVQDGLPGHSKAHQHHQHDHHEVQHVNHLQRERRDLREALSTTREHSGSSRSVCQQHCSKQKENLLDIVL